MSTDNRINPHRISKSNHPMDILNGERGDCEYYNYRSSIDWAMRKFNQHNLKQFDIVQVVDAGASFNLGNPQNCIIDDKNPNVCINQGLRLIVSMADNGSKLKDHSEQYILEKIAKIQPSEPRTHSHNRPKDLVIISTNTPCGGCHKRKQLLKMCNGINDNAPFVYIEHDEKMKEDPEWVSQPNAQSLFSKCIFLYRNQYGNSDSNWETELRQFYRKDRWFNDDKHKPRHNPWLFESCGQKQQVQHTNLQQQPRRHSKRRKKVPIEDIVAEHEINRARNPDQKRKDVVRRKQSEEIRHRDRKSTARGTKRSKSYGPSNKNSDDYAAMEYFDLLYDGGAGYGHDKLEQAQVSDLIYINPDEYLLTATAIFFGLFILCCIMIFSCIYGAIFRSIGQNLVKNQMCNKDDTDEDDHLDFEV